MNKAITYNQHGKFNSQQAFIERYSVLVKRIAHHLLGSLPPSVQVEDLIQYRHDRSYRSSAEL